MDRLGPAARATARSPPPRQTLTDDAQPTEALTSPAADPAIADVGALDPTAGGGSADEGAAGQPADEPAEGVPAEEGRAARRAQASGAGWSMPPAARKWAAIGGAGVLVLAGLGLVIARPWDTTPKTCAEAVAALAGGSADQAVLEAVTDTCGTVEEFAAEAEKYPGSFATDSLASGIGTICSRVSEPATARCARTRRQGRSRAVGPAPAAAEAASRPAVCLAHRGWRAASSRS